MGEKQLETQKTILTEDLIDQMLARIAKNAAQTPMREYMNFVEFREKVADWSDKTIRRRIKDEGFPCVQDGATTLIPRDKMKLWFKKREQG